MKINNFRGDSSDVSAKKEALDTSVSVLAEIPLNSRNFGKSLKNNRNIRLFERALRLGNRRISKSPETLSLTNRRKIKSQGCISVKF